MVKSIVCLEAHLDVTWALLSSNINILLQDEIGIVKPWTMEEIAFDVTKCPQRLW
jgi:hypothetical protein